MGLEILEVKGKEGDVQVQLVKISEYRVQVFNPFRDFEYVHQGDDVEFAQTVLNDKAKELGIG